jgi:hypothetical protein
MKKLESLGRSLSKEEQKGIKGGVIDPGGTFCSQGQSCRYYESGTGYVTGECQKNSNNVCVCKAENSSVVWPDCING